MLLHEFFRSIKPRSIVQQDTAKSDPTCRIEVRRLAHWIWWSPRTPDLKICDSGHKQRPRVWACSWLDRWKSGGLTSVRLQLHLFYTFILVVKIVQNCTIKDRLYLLFQWYSRSDFYITFESSAYKKTAIRTRHFKSTLLLRAFHKIKVQPWLHSLHRSIQINIPRN